MPKVSVLMPIYKTNEKHLREAIESILNQTYTDFEFLILNDSPEERYLDAIIDSYADKRILYYKNEKNLGITPSRNKLIDMAIGEYLAVMDHDDISLPKRFEKQVDFLNTHKDYGVIGSGFILTSNNKEDYNPTTNRAIKRELLTSCAVMHPSSMIRKSILQKENLRYEEEFSPSEDYALWCRLITKTKFYNIPEVLFSYREHDDRTTNKQRKKMDDTTIAIYKFVRNKKPLAWAAINAKHTAKIFLRNTFYSLKIINKIDYPNKRVYKLFGKFNIYIKKI